MDLILEDFETAAKCTAVPIELQTPAVGEMQVTPPSDRYANLTKIREEVSKLIDVGLLEYEKQLKEALENMTVDISAHLLLREQARNDEVQGRKDRIRKGTLELDGWLTSWVSKWLSKPQKKPSGDMPENHSVNSKMHRDMKHDLRTTLGLMEFRNQKDMYMRHMKACDDENIFQKNTNENIKALESAYKDMMANISKRLDDMWANFNVPNLNQNEVYPDTSDGPLEKTAAPTISSRPSVSTATPRNSKEGLDILEPQEEFKRAKHLRPIIRLRNRSRKLVKLKARDKAVMPIIQENDYDTGGKAEVQAESKLQERIKMFEVKSEEGRKVEVNEKKAQKSWRRIFSWFLPKYC